MCLRHQCTFGAAATLGAELGGTVALCPWRVQQARLLQRSLDKPSYRPRLEEASVTAWIPHDFGFAPVLPEASHLFAWMHESVGNAA